MGRGTYTGRTASGTLRVVDRDVMGRGTYPGKRLDL